MTLIVLAEKEESLGGYGLLLGGRFLCLRLIFLQLVYVNEKSIILRQILER